MYGVLCGWPAQLLSCVGEGGIPPYYINYYASEARS